MVVPPSPKKSRPVAVSYEYAEELDSSDTSPAEEEKADTITLADEIANVTTLLESLVQNEEARILYTVTDLDELCISLLHITQRSIDEKYDCTKMLY